MNPPSIETFLHLTAPKHPQVSNIPHGVAQILERAASEIYSLLALAHTELKAIHQPDDLRGTLVDWDGHAPLQLEVREDRHGKVHLLDIRVRGASVSEHLDKGLWDKAEQFINERVWVDPSPAIAQRAAIADRADERQERAA